MRTASTRCALPVRQPAGWRVWRAARFTALVSLPPETTAPAMRVLQSHSKPVRHGRNKKKKLFCQRLTVRVSTVPCPPSQLNVSMNCANHSASLSWSVSPNALSYTGKAANSEGHTVVCEAQANPQCRLLGLHCGREYTFTVSASAGDCQSPDSEPVVLKTGKREQHRALYLSVTVTFWIIHVI